MENIDLKDRKILYHLDINSRQSFSQIGKKVGLHKDVVAHRVKKLQEAGIITRFYPVLDMYKLGYTTTRLYFELEEIEKQREREFIAFVIDIFMEYGDDLGIQTKEEHKKLSDQLQKIKEKYLFEIIQLFLKMALMF